MNEQKPSTIVDDVKYESTDYDKYEDIEEIEEEKPPRLAPPAPIPRYRIAVANFSKPGNFTNDVINDSCDSQMNYSSVERYNEEVTMRFMFGNGKPLSTIDDPHFLKFMHHLNRTRAPPESGNMTTKAMAEHRPDIKYQRINGPLCVTIEAVRKNDEIFLSISSHFYTARGERQNSVHFEKVILADYEGKVVADRIRRVVDANKCMNFAVSYILSPNLRMLTLVSENMPVKNKFICFFSYLSNIAREAICYPEISGSLKVLRTYVNAIHNHQEVYTKFRKCQMEIGSSVDIPSLDVDGEWLSTLHFLSTCSILNETFKSVHENWCMPSYLNAEQENALSNLYDYLLALCQVSSQICGEDSCASQVLHSMSVINNAIGNCRIQSVREKMFKTFHKFFTAMSNGKVGEFYQTASLLDPRFGYSSLIFNMDDWNNVENKLIEEAEVIHSRRISLRYELSVFKKLLINPPEFNEVTTAVTWWNDHQEEMPMLYRQWIEFSSVPAVSIDGKRFFAKGGKLAHLFATLDEELHLKAMLLAQSSQEFIGRGNVSQLVESQISDFTNKFNKIDQISTKTEAPETENQVESVVKEEFFDHAQTAQMDVEREIKNEEPDNLIAYG